MGALPCSGQRLIYPKDEFMSSFEKYHGLGNDFVVIELKSENEISVSESVRLCDRHFGIGADGILYVLPASKAQADCRFQMVVINSDGSRPEMCGNGLRCVALYLVHAQKEATGDFWVQTDAGPRSCTVSLEGTDTATVKTSLGTGREVGQIKANVLGNESSFIQVSMGNPHAIIFRQRLLDSELDELGARLSKEITDGSNVEIAELIGPNQIIVDVWERGVGRTLACGTGAAATAFAAIKHGHADAMLPIQVTLPGGTLEVLVDEEDQVILTGPAARVYAGKLQ